MRLEKYTLPVGLALALSSASCASWWEGAVARRVAHDVLSLRSYRGQLLERGMVVGDPNAVVVKDVLFEKPWKIRVEVI